MADAELDTVRAQDSVLVLLSILEQIAKLVCTISKYERQRS